jgi:hypothetical protein
MSIVTQMFPEQSEAQEARLNAFGLSTPFFHGAFRRGLNNARNRSSAALTSSKANDIYHDTNEQIRLMLAPQKWRSIMWERQPRLAHPEGKMALVIASATGVGLAHPRLVPITRKKGPATLNSITRTAAPTHSTLEIPEFEMDPEEVKVLAEAPLWMALHELTEHGLNLELSKPAGFRANGCVDVWEERIPIASIRLDGDFSVFKIDDGGDEFDVPVDPR